MSRKLRIVEGRVKTSPSVQQMIRLRNRTTNLGGVTEDFDVAVERIREVRRALLFDRCSFLYTPSSYAEDKATVVYPELKNLVKDSENLNTSNSFFNYTAALTVNANVAVAPDGTTTAERLIPSTQNAYLGFNSSVRTFPLNTRITISGYFKADGFDKVQLGGVVIPSERSVFNLTTGTVVSSGVNVYSASITSVGNGWYRCVNTYKFTNGIGNFFLYSGIFIGTPAVPTGVENILAWGLQVYEGEDSPYLKTSTDASMDFAFIRTGRATRTNKQGVNELVPYNLATNSNIPVVVAGVTLTANNTVSPTGFIDAYKVVESSDVANTTHSFTFSLTSPDVVIGEIFTFSFYAKANGRNLRMAFSSAAFGSSAFLFDLVNGTVISGAATISSVGSGWYLCTATVTAVAAVAGVSSLQPTFRLLDGSNSFSYIGGGTLGVYAWGFQVVRGTPLPYIKTTDRIDVPRLDYSRSLLRPSLLIEPSRTNLLLRSEELDNAAWLSDPNPVSITANASIAPNNSLTADKIVESVLSSSHVRYQSFSPTAAAHTFSVYLKAGERSIVRLTFAAASVSNGVEAYFDLANGTVIGSAVANGSATLPSAAISPAANGFYRCSVTITFPNTTTVYPAIWVRSAANASNYTGTAGYGIYAWGAQVELGANITSYIPTTTATVGRGNESMTVDLINGNVLLNTNNFTLFCEGHLYFGGAGSPTIGLGDATNLFGSETLSFYNGIRPYVRSANVANIPGTNMANGNAYKFVIQRNGTTVKFFRNGVQDGTTQTIPVASYRYLVVATGGTTLTLNKLALFNQTLSDLECIALTT